MAAWRSRAGWLWRRWTCDCNYEERMTQPKDRFVQCASPAGLHRIAYIHLKAYEQRRAAGRL